MFIRVFSLVTFTAGYYYIQAHHVAPMLQNALDLFP